jgi:hypothetical protein
MSDMAQRISDALDDALKNEIAGAVSILYRKLVGEEDATSASDSFRRAIEIARAVDEEARKIVEQIFSVSAIEG